MKRTLIIGTLLLTTALFIGAVYYPASPLMWLAGTTLKFEIARGIVMAALIAILVTTPPRAVWFRYVLGATSLVLGVGSIIMMFQYTLPIVDTVVFIESAIILGIEALEASYKHATVLPSRHLRGTLNFSEKYYS